MKKNMTESTLIQKWTAPPWFRFARAVLEDFPISKEPILQEEESLQSWLTDKSFTKESQVQSYFSPKLIDNLSDADLSGVNVSNARFRDNLGISESMKRDLIQRGAVFEDSPPGDRSGVLTSV